VGFILEKLEVLAFNTTFDPVKRTGKVPINTSLISKSDFPRALAAMRETFKAGLCVSELVATASEGEKLGSVVIPEGTVGLATVCSVVINGVLLKSGVPIESRFGGVLEIKDSRPRRFVAIISYAGTSLDPSEQYIRARMTTVTEAARTGNGKILANFREIPAPARSIVEEKLHQLREAGIGGVYALGNTSEPVCQIAVGLNRVGLVLLGGLNPIAAAAEAGIEVTSFGSAMLAALVIGLLNTLVRPVLVVLTLPITLLTLGLFYFVLNGLLFWLAGNLLSGFAVHGFITAMLGAILYSVIAWALSALVPGDKG
ncbi:MAG: NrpR regulatory domain-containing protein, partial [Thiobacillus sp.]|nr:NrpR regulatory domain-containing protein [Thiobacillus sp.]